MAEVAQKVAKQHGLEIKVLGPKECEKLGMGMFLAVAQGSRRGAALHPPHLRPKGKTPSKKKIALIGKGVTFDSGGLSLKPSNAMEDMKIDMSGAAAVIAAIGVLADLGVPYEVHAHRRLHREHAVGQVVQARRRAQVDGRQDRRDQQHRRRRAPHARRRASPTRSSEVKPDEIFDFATLTGACMVALGPYIAGVMGNDLSLVERWLAAGAPRRRRDVAPAAAASACSEQLKSEIADMRNTGDRYGGALTAGLFLKEFVGDTPWVHVDIAGPAAADKESRPRRRRAAPASGSPRSSSTWPVASNYCMLRA